MPRTRLHVVSCAHVMFRGRPDVASCADVMSRGRPHVASCADVMSRGRPHVASCADVRSRGRPDVASCADVMPRARPHVAFGATRFAARCLAVTTTASMAGSSQHGPSRHGICVASALTCGALCATLSPAYHRATRAAEIAAARSGPHVRSTLAPHAREPRVTAPNNPHAPGCALAHGKSVNIAVEAHTRPERTIGETRKLPIRRQKTAARG